MCANSNTHPTATRCSVLGENVKQKTCTSVDWDWYNDMSPVNIFHVTTWPFSSPLAMNRRCPATDQWAVVSLCWNHSQIHQMHCIYTTLHHMCHNTSSNNMINTKDVLSKRWPRDVRYISGSNSRCGDMAIRNYPRWRPAINFDLM